MGRCALAAGSLLVAACNGGSGLACRDMDALQGIQMIPPHVPHSKGRVFTITACLEDDCHTTRAGGRRDLQATHPVVGADLRSSDPVEVRMVVHDDQHHVVFRGHATVAPLEYRPNGPGCEPTVWVGAVRAHGRHILVAEKLSLG